MAANPRFTWHKLTCPAGCGRVERYRGLAVLGAPGHMCYGCKLGPMRVSEVHWGHEKYATSRGKAGTVEKLPKLNPAMHVASLLFDKRVFTAAQAKAWAHAHGYRYGTLEEGGPAAQYWHLPQQLTGRVKRIVPFGSTASGIRAIVARNPNPRGVCECEHASHFPEPHLRSHPYGASTSELQMLKTPYGTYKICGICLRAGHMQAPYRNPRGRSLWKIRTAFKYQYAPGVLDRFTPTVMVGRPIAPGTWVRLLAKRPAGGKAIRGWGRTFAWIADEHGNEQIVFKRALAKR